MEMQVIVLVIVQTLTFQIRDFARVNNFQRQHW